MTRRRNASPDDAPLETARRDALRLLKARPRTRRELSDRLIKKGHAATIIATLLDAFTRAGLIDDAAVARAHAASALQRSPRSETWLRQSLRRRGIEGKLAADIAKESIRDRDPLQDATALAARRLALARRSDPPETTTRRLVAFLVRRGFDLDICRRAVEQATLHRIESQD